MYIYVPHQWSVEYHVKWKKRQWNKNTIFFYLYVESKKNQQQSNRQNRNTLLGSEHKLMFTRMKGSGRRDEKVKEIKIYKLLAIKIVMGL